MIRCLLLSQVTSSAPRCLPCSRLERWPLLRQWRRTQTCSREYKRGGCSSRLLILSFSSQISLKLYSYSDVRQRMRHSATWLAWSWSALRCRLWSIWGWGIPWRPGSKTGWCWTKWCRGYDTWLVMKTNLSARFFAKKYFLLDLLYSLIFIVGMLWLKFSFSPARTASPWLSPPTSTTPRSISLPWA